jgi:hypothetical protein
MVTGPLSYLEVGGEQADNFQIADKWPACARSKAFVAVESCWSRNGEDSQGRRRSN